MQQYICVLSNLFKFPVNKHRDQTWKTKVHILNIFGMNVHFSKVLTAVVFGVVTSRVVFCVHTEFPRNKSPSSSGQRIITFQSSSIWPRSST
jgi:MFS superfamily sulfate permease-like transporter